MGDFCADRVLFTNLAIGGKAFGNGIRILIVA